MTRSHRVCAGIALFGALTTGGPAAMAQGVTPNAPSSPSNEPGLQAGGLLPPGSGNQATPPRSSEPGVISTAQGLDVATEKDSGRGLEFVWLNADVGYQLLGLQALKNKGLVDGRYLDNTQSGLTFSGGAGVRLIFFTFGGRFRMGTFSDYSLYTVNAEAGLHLPMGRFEPHFLLGGGYASLGAPNPSTDALHLRAADFGARGWNIRAGAGADVYLTNVVTVGANLTFDTLFLSRSKVSANKLGDPADGPAGQLASLTNARDTYARAGSSIGASLAATAVVGLHF